MTCPHPALPPHPGDVSDGLRVGGVEGGERSVRPCPFYLLQEAIGYPSLHHGSRLVTLLLGVIAEHVRQHLGIEDAARR